MCLKPRSSPFNAIESATGLNLELQKHSTQCDIASIPVAAVSSGGIKEVSSGSHILARGIRWSLIIANFLSSLVVTNAARPTSLPLPAVVGMAISGGMMPVIFDPPPELTAYVSIGGLWFTSTATHFARSIGEPPPSAIIPSHPFFV